MSDKSKTAGVAAILAALAIGASVAAYLPLPNYLKTSSQIRADLDKAMVSELCPESGSICPVPLVTLIDFSDAFDGRTVLTSGLLILEFEGNALYLTQDAYRMRDYKRSISVSIDRRLSAKLELGSQRVKLSGEFSGGGAGTYGHEGLWPGKLTVSEVWVEEESI